MPFARMMKIRLSKTPNLSKASEPSLAKLFSLSCHGTVFDHQQGHNVCRQDPAQMVPLLRRTDRALYNLGFVFPLVET